jgi:hypothetical protein
VTLSIEATQYNIGDKMPNIIVHNVAVQPETYSLYFYRDNWYDIKVLFGSG